VGNPGHRVDPDALHAREIDDQGVIDDAEVGEAVTAAADREREAMLMGEGHCCRDVGGVRRADDRQRAAVDREIDEPACLVIVRVTGRNELSDELRAERVQLVVVERQGTNGRGWDGRNGHGRLLSSV
jgi:hypothetical protein